MVVDDPEDGGFALGLKKPVAAGRPNGRWKEAEPWELTAPGPSPCMVRGLQLIFDLEPVSVHLANTRKARWRTAATPQMHKTLGTRRLLANPRAERPCRALRREAATAVAGRRLPANSRISMICRTLRSGSSRRSASMLWVAGLFKQAAILLRQSPGRLRTGFAGCRYRRGNSVRSPLQ